LDRFDGVNTQVLGISVDSTACLTAWAESLGNITYPLLSDFYPHGHIARLYGVFRVPDGYSERALFIIDKSCTIRYVDVHNIDEQPDNEVLFRALSEIETPRGTLSTAKPVPAEPPKPFIEPEADVVMYCTPWCPGCRRARAFFQEKGIQFVEVDITRDRGAAQRVRGWANGNETTPTFNIKGTIIVNFDQDKVARALGIL
jgi:glutaredoxin